MDPIAQPHESISAADSAAPVILPGSRPLPAPHILLLAWKSNAPGTPAVDFAVSLASRLFDVCHEVVSESRTGEIVDDLALDELALAIRNAEIKTVRFRTGRAVLADEWQLDCTPSDATTSASCRLTVTVCPNEQLWTQVQWLQASFDHPSPIPLLAIPYSAAGVSIAVFHGIVVLAARFAPLDRAELKHISTDNPTETVARWWFDDPPVNVVPVIAHETGSLWLATTEPPPAATEPACWVEVVSSDMPVAEKATVAPDEDWQARLSALLSSSPLDSNELATHLQTLAPVPVPFRVCPLNEAPVLESMSPQQDGIVCVLVPTASAVHIGIDFEQAKDGVRQALLHAYGHLLLGHVQPGDVYGHWDTVDTLSAEHPHRRWDREVRETFAAWLQPAARKVDSLDDCTPLEKAQLGLWRMIGEMLGESRRLHPLAERYQKAVYQRQAAQRMVAMLEDYGGAMLCDGVGLGKTYVATTLIVHDVNTWKDRHAADPDRIRTDPFRITVLSPNSVVSTWRREAMPTLSAFGVPLATLRVVSHTKLSRLTRTSELLQRSARDTMSDLEHLLLSDLVIVDEAHNFRSVAARRTRVLRDLLRLQPRREVRRRVVLLTATPVNNSLEDLRQEAGLLFSRPLWLSDARTDDGYRRQAVREVEDRCARARNHRTAQGDVAALVIHGQAEARFSDAIEFRDDLDFGPNVQRIGDYLKEQDDRLKVLQDDICAAARAGTVHTSADGPVRIAEELLDRIVVQRSRALCKTIERQQGSNVELLFRPDQGMPEKRYYADEYDGTGDVLARFLPLFDTPRQPAQRDPGTRPLSLKVYMWYDVREGIKSADETSSVVGLQRVLVLKRLESSPVAFLITLLRLAVLHAHRLQQLLNRCLAVGDRDRSRTLEAELKSLLDKQSDDALDKIRSLATDDPISDPRVDCIQALSQAYSAARPAADTDDLPPQLSLFAESDDGGPQRNQLDRLWTLREALLDDLATLFEVTPDLADIIFGRFARAEWPRRFTAGGEAVDWPRSAAWGLRLITDAKLRCLVGRLLQARRADQKVIVFSQFSDTIAYIQSVLRACQAFSRNEWQLVLRGVPDIQHLRQAEITALLATTATITGGTEARDEVVNAFAPFYRISPQRPVTERVGEAEQKRLLDEWAASWQQAMECPCHILISSDILAEGVNLQDVALLINFDVHWNPVRMIQRAGRIDRRLNPAIEKSPSFPELEALARQLRQPMPTYYWHTHPHESPVTVNLILPDELEAELLLRERIATKTLAIDFTLGLEQGTGAEADWMADYTYQGISSLNSFQKDRAIEQVAGYHEKLTQVLTQRGIQGEWASGLNSWLRARDAHPGSPLIGRAWLGRKGGELERFSRYLEPAVKDGVPYWFWAEKTPGASLFDGWLILDGRSEHFPPQPDRTIPWYDNVASPIKATHLLGAALYLDRGAEVISLSPSEIARPLLQGASALAAPKLGSADDRRMIALRDFFILQLSGFDPEQPAAQMAEPTNGSDATRRGSAQPCPVCGHPPGIHRCCPRCEVSAGSEAEIERLFGFMRQYDSHGAAYDLPQP